MQFSSVTSLHLTSLHHDMRVQQALCWPHFHSAELVRGGTLKTNTTVGVFVGNMWGCLRWMDHSGLAVYWDRWYVLSLSAMLRFRSDPWGHWPKWTLCFVHFPSLSQSGSGVLTTIGYVLCFLLRSKLLRQLGGKQDTVQSRPCILCTRQVPTTRFVCKWVRGVKVQKKYETSTLQKQSTFNKVRRGSSQTSELLH